MRPLHAGVPDRSEKDTRRPDAGQARRIETSRQDVHVPRALLCERIRRHTGRQADKRNKASRFRRRIRNGARCGTGNRRNGTFPRGSTRRGLPLFGMSGRGGLHPQIRTRTDSQHHAHRIAHDSPCQNSEGALRRRHQNHLRGPLHRQKIGSRYLRRPCGGGHHLQGPADVVRTGGYRTGGDRGRRRRDLRPLPLRSRGDVSGRGRHARRIPFAGQAGYAYGFFGPAHRQGRARTTRHREPPRYDIYGTARLQGRMHQRPGQAQGYLPGHQTLRHHGQVRDGKSLKGFQPSRLACRLSGRPAGDEDHLPRIPDKRGARGRRQDDCGGRAQLQFVRLRHLPRLCGSDARRTGRGQHVCLVHAEGGSRQGDGPAAEDTRRSGDSERRAQDSGHEPHLRSLHGRGYAGRLRHVPRHGGGLAERALPVRVHVPHRTRHGRGAPRTAHQRG